MDKISLTVRRSEEEAEFNDLVEAKEEFIRTSEEKLEEFERELLIRFGKIQILTKLLDEYEDEPIEVDGVIDMDSYGGTDAE